MSRITNWVLSPASVAAAASESLRIAEEESADGVVLRDHSNHPHPHLQTCSKFEVPKYITDEYNKLLLDLP